MCGRFALKASPAEVLAYFELDECADFSRRFNIPPGTDIPVIRQSPEGRRVLSLLRWGLVPHWAKDPRIGVKLSNARGETLAEKPSFRNAFERRRCLVPASGFYEWKAAGKLKQPYYISLKSGAPMALAGLWESWTAPDGAVLRTVCVVTTGPNAVMEPIHERMPVIIGPEHWQDWLAAPAENIGMLLAAYPAERMNAWPVDVRVGRTGNDDATLIQPSATP